MTDQRKHEGRTADVARSALLSAAWLACCSAALFISGCGRPAGAIFEPLAQPLVWPSPPDPPRIHYVGALATESDLRPARSMPQMLGAAIFGRGTARSMLSPFGVTAHGSRVMVCDSNAQCVHMFDLDTRRYEQWKPSKEHARFAQPVGIAYDAGPPARVLVADSAAGAIFAFDERGRSLGWFGGDHLSRPAGVAVDPERNRILIADPGLHQVVILNGDGDFLTRLGTRGSGTRGGKFNFPTNVAVDNDGRIYVSDSLNFRIQVFEANLDYAGQIGRHGRTLGHFSQPKGVTVDRRGHIYVVDAHFEAVQIFNPEGQLLLSFGHEGRGPGEFWLPAGIFAAADDRIWVADTYNRRIQVFEYREPPPPAQDPEAAPAPADQQGSSSMERSTPQAAGHEERRIQGGMWGPAWPTPRGRHWRFVICHLSFREVSL